MRTGIYRREPHGFSVVEVLVALTLLTGLMLAVMVTYSQGTRLSRRTRSQIRIQDNVRLAMGRMEQDLRMIGFGVPQDDRVGASDHWTPVVFYASPTEIGFRAELDGGNALITCTPSTGNSDCPISELHLESVAYHDALSCKQPDDSGAWMKLVAVRDGGAWEPATCGGVNATDKTIDVSDVTDDTFSAGVSEVVTVEQVYYRYAPSSQPPYGVLQSYVRYDNLPDDDFPPSPVDWTTVANHLTDFWLEYRDAAGSTLSGNPLSATDREAIRKVILSMEGYDQASGTGTGQRIEARTEILVRNPNGQSS